MFDIGFGELLLIAVIALLVLGPERLPGAVRSATLWLARMKRAFNEIKTEFEREIGADEIRRDLHNESIMKQLGDEGREIGRDLDEVRKGLKDLQYDVNRGAEQETTAETPAGRDDGKDPPRQSS